MPTLSDVARVAGVSYATADRVVNGRGGVAEKSAARVREAVAALGYVRNIAAANLARRRRYRFATILPAGPNAFFARMRGILRDAARDLASHEVDLRLIEVPAFDPAALSAALAGLTGEGIDGVALVGSDHPDVVAEMGRARASGLAVLTLVSDVPDAPRDAYVGIDNVVAGRTAARLILLAHGGRRGRVLPVVGALSARDHAGRLAGLRATLGTAALDLSLAGEIEGRDRSETVEARVGAALAAEPQITAIYSAGAGNAGLLRALAGLPGGRRRPVVVLHELVAHSRAALERDAIDAVIDQRPEAEVARALSSLRRIADRRPPASEGPILPAIYVKENLPPDTTAARQEDIIA